MEKSGRFDLVMISPDDPEAMVRHTDSCRGAGIPFAADPSQQLARMNGDEIRTLIDGATYLFLNEYELALAMQKTGWGDEEILSRVGTRVVTLSSDGAKVERNGEKEVRVSVPKEKAKVDPTGVGDAFRSGYLAGIAWGLEAERCAQLGSMIATYVIETKGTQEYRFNKSSFLARFTGAYGAQSASEIEPHLQIA
jgi:adenosine kinase